MRRVLLTLVWCLIAALAALTAGARTLFVPSVAYPTIQSAVDASQPNDVVKVSAGIYHETVVINQSAIQLVSEAGATLMGTGDAGTTGITINSGGVTVRGLVIMHYDTGIASQGGGNTIKMNSLLYNNVGLFCTTGTEDDGNVAPLTSVFDHNIISCNTFFGIWLNDSQNVNVTQNVVDNNGTAGIYLLFSIECKVAHNDASINGQHGIWLDFGSHDNVITQNSTLLNGVTDLQDDSGASNLWTHNVYRTAAGI